MQAGGLPAADIGTVRRAESEAESPRMNIRVDATSTAVRNLAILTPIGLNTNSWTPMRPAIKFSTTDQGGLSQARHALCGPAQGVFGKSCVENDPDMGYDAQQYGG
jgi:hypothetical protein